MMKMFKRGNDGAYLEANLKNITVDFLLRVRSTTTVRIKDQFPLVDPLDECHFMRIEGAFGEM